MTDESENKDESTPSLAARLAGIIARPVDYSKRGEELLRHLRGEEQAPWAVDEFFGAAKPPEPDPTNT